MHCFSQSSFGWQPSIHLLLSQTTGGEQRKIFPGKSGHLFLSEPSGSRMWQVRSVSEPLLYPPGTQAPLKRIVTSHLQVLHVSFSHLLFCNKFFYVTPQPRLGHWGSSHGSFRRYDPRKWRHTTRQRLRNQVPPATTQVHSSKSAAARHVLPARQEAAGADSAFFREQGRWKYNDCFLRAHSFHGDVQTVTESQLLSEAPLTQVSA